MEGPLSVKVAVTVLKNDAKAMTIRFMPAPPRVFRRLTQANIAATVAEVLSHVKNHSPVAIDIIGEVPSSVMRMLGSSIPPDVVLKMPMQGCKIPFIVSPPQASDDAKADLKTCITIHHELDPQEKVADVAVLLHFKMQRAWSLDKNTKLDVMQVIKQTTGMPVYEHIEACLVLDDVLFIEDRHIPALQQRIHAFADVLRTNAQMAGIKAVVLLISLPHPIAFAIGQQFRPDLCKGLQVFDAKKNDEGYIILRAPPTDK